MQIKSKAILWTDRTIYVMNYRDVSPPQNNFGFTAHEEGVEAQMVDTEV